MHMNPVHIITAHTLRNILNCASQCKLTERLCEISLRLVYNLRVLPCGAETVRRLIT